MPLFNFDNGETFGNKNEGVIYYQSETSKVHDTHELPNSRNILQKRVSQHIAANSLMIEITAPGTTELRVGDVVNFTLPKYAPNSKNDVKDNDKYLSGRYLISAARHHVSTLNKRHTLALELIKDSFNVSLPQESIELFTNNEAQDGGPYRASAIDDL